MSLAFVTAIVNPLDLSADISDRRRSPARQAMVRSLFSQASPVVLSSVLAIAVLLPSDGAVAAEEASWKIAPVSGWVEAIAPFSSSDTKRELPIGGFDMQFSDRQHRALDDQPYAYYRAVEYGFTNRHGVAEHSQISIDFDPSYEQLSIHEVTVQRDGERIDKLPTLRADLLRQERDLDALIYDGTHSLTLLLNDIRVGDVLRYAFTIDGENPVLAGQREIGAFTSRSNRRGHRERTRIISSAPMHRRQHGRAMHAIENSHADGVETIVTPELPEHGSDGDAGDNGSLVFSDVSDWSDVVAWAAPLYALDQTRPAELIDVAAQIETSHDTDAARIGAALRWVQDQIRYFGIELGADSHKPASPELTLQRRFADCKGKALLLIDLLAELGIQADPALVNTEGDLGDETYPLRLHAFDHVIVHVEFDGKSHYIDPTRRYQRGNLGDFFEPDYDGALILADGETSLRDMSSQYAGDEMSIDKTLVISAGNKPSAELNVTSIRTGATAERFRAYVESDGLTQIGKDFLSYYQSDFDDIELLDGVASRELEGNRVETIERYHVPAYWTHVDDDANGSRWMTGDELLGWLETLSDEEDVTEDKALAHPLTLREHWTVKAPDRFTFDHLEGSLETPWFRFTKTATLDDDETEVGVTMHYESLRGTLAPDERDAYATAIDELVDIAGFHVTSEVEPRWMAYLDTFVERLDERDEKHADILFDDKTKARRYIDMVELAMFPLAIGAIGVTVVRRRRERRQKELSSERSA